MRKETGWYNLLKGNESESRAVAFGSLNGMIGLLVAAYYTQLLFIFGVIIAVLALLSFIGVAFVMARKYAVGAILMGISGACFFPIGVIGIIGAKIAWTYTDRYKKKHKSQRKSRMARRQRNS